MNVQVRDLSAVDRNSFVSQASYWIPELLNVSAWLEHAPFGFLLFGALRPRTIVALGVHTGSPIRCSAKRCSGYTFPRAVSQSIRGWAISTRAITAMTFTTPCACTTAATIL